MDDRRVKIANEINKYRVERVIEINKRPGVFETIRYINYTFPKMRCTVYLTMRTVLLAPTSSDNRGCIVVCRKQEKLFLHEILHKIVDDGHNNNK